MIDNAHSVKKHVFWGICCLVIGLVFLGSACTEPDPPAPESPSTPAWAADAVFYQIFPTRFRNGDPNNDPDRESLEYPENVPDTWRISSWTGDWYVRDAWEMERGDDFYEDGVFDRRYGGDLQGGALIFGQKKNEYLPLR